MHNSTENANGTGARPKTQKQFEGFHKERASPINQRVFPRTDEERPDGGDYDDDDADQHYSFCQRDFKDEFPSYRHSGAHGKAFPEGIFWSDSKNLNQVISFVCVRLYVCMYMYTCRPTLESRRGHEAFTNPQIWGIFY